MFRRLRAFVRRLRVRRRVATTLALIDRYEVSQEKNARRPLLSGAQADGHPTGR